MFEATARKQQQQQQQQQQQCGSAGATDSANGYSDEQQQLCELQQTVSSMRAQCMRTLGTAAMDELRSLIGTTALQSRQSVAYTERLHCTASVVLMSVCATLLDARVGVQSNRDSCICHCQRQWSVMSHNTYTVVQAVLIAVAHAHTAVIHTVATILPHARARAHSLHTALTIALELIACISIVVVMADIDQLAACTVCSGYLVDECGLSIADACEGVALAQKLIAFEHCLKKAAKSLYVIVACKRQYSKCYKRARTALQLRYWHRFPKRSLQIAHTAQSVTYNAPNRSQIALGFISSRGSRTYPPTPRAVKAIGVAYAVRTQG
eukprot:16608-Heterococcus_DN1.PRE.3